MKDVPHDTPDDIAVDTSGIKQHRRPKKVALPKRRFDSLSWAAKNCFKCYTRTRTYNKTGVNRREKMVCTPNHVLNGAKSHKIITGSGLNYTRYKV